MRTSTGHIGFRLLVLLAALAGGVAAPACGSGEPAPEAGPAREAQQGAAPAEFGRLDPGRFAARMTNPDAKVINVHVPYEGELEDTDAFIHFERIVGDAQLPADKDSEVLLYCMSGRMSEIAGDALINQAGYTNVAHLEGGMKAWEAAGRTLINQPSQSSH